MLRHAALDSVQGSNPATATDDKCTGGSVAVDILMSLGSTDLCITSSTQAANLYSNNNNTHQLTSKKDLRRHLVGCKNIRNLRQHRRKIITCQK